MKTSIEIINGREFLCHVPEHGGKLICVETGQLYDEVYIPSDTTYTFEDYVGSDISDVEALKIITEGE